MYIQKNVFHNGITNSSYITAVAFFVETKQAVTLKIMCRIQKVNEKIRVIKPVTRKNIEEEDILLY